MTTGSRIFSGGLGAMALAVCTVGCESSRTGAGFTNPNAGSMTGREKAATSTDFTVPAAGLGKDAPVAEGVASENGGTDVLPTSKGGIGATPGVRETSPEATTTPPSRPPTKENTGSAAGATKPADKINTGTPRPPTLTGSG